MADEEADSEGELGTNGVSGCLGLGARGAEDTGKAQGDWIRARRRDSVNENCAGVRIAQRPLVPRGSWTLVSYPESPPHVSLAWALIDQPRRVCFADPDPR
jgi:hypothetical protein